MKIVSSTLQFEASHSTLQQHDIQESIRAWVGRRPEREDSRQRAATPPPVAEPVQISDAGQAAQASDIENSIDAAKNDPKLRLIRAMIALLTGKDVLVFDAGELTGNAPPPETPATTAVPPQTTGQAAAYGLEYDRHESYSESEQTSFEANGVIRTADGKEISFSLSLLMTRSYHEESDVSIRLGDARQKKDPLILSFNGSAAQLSDQRFKFDLNADGQAESINFVAGGSGFLALDRNGDGKINNGAELFGAKTGNGFAELSALDGDRNGWIDENDAAYAQLRVWTKDSAGNDRLSTLKQANVGALNLGSVSTPFDIKDAQNSLQGQIRSSGIFLQDDGRTGIIQQVDLTI